MNDEVDQMFVVTTVEIIVREQEVWAADMSEAAEFVENTERQTDGVEVHRDAFLFRVEVAE